MPIHGSDIKSCLIQPLQRHVFFCIVKSVLFLEIKCPTFSFVLRESMNNNYLGKNMEFNINDFFQFVV